MFGVGPDEADLRGGQAGGLEKVGEHADGARAGRSNGDEQDGIDLVGVEQFGEPSRRVFEVFAVRCAHE